MTGTSGEQSDSHHGLANRLERIPGVVSVDITGRAGLDVEDLYIRFVDPNLDTIVRHSAAQASSRVFVLTAQIENLSDDFLLALVEQLAQGSFSQVGRELEVRIGGELRRLG